MNTPERKRIIGISDLYVSSDTADVLITYALGSCLGITFHDRYRQIGGMLHALLPLASLDPTRAASSPATFVDTGIDLLLHECLRRGASRADIEVTVAGGAEIGFASDSDRFRVGYFNILEMKHAMNRHGLHLTHADTGGDRPRTLSLAIDSGKVNIVTTSALGRVA